MKLARRYKRRAFAHCSRNYVRTTVFQRNVLELIRDMTLTRDKTEEKGEGKQSVRDEPRKCFESDIAELSHLDRSISIFPKVR